MKWAFWRSETGKGGRANAAARPEKEARDPDVERVDQAAALRTQARRRLIGAAVLLLVTAAVVPLVLDPLPRPLPESIPIEVRGDKTPFTPKVPLPLPDPASLQGAPPPDAARDTESAAGAATGATVAAGGAEVKVADGRPADGTAADSKGSDSKGSDSKGSDANAAASKVGDAKSGASGATAPKPATDKGGNRPESKSDNKADATKSSKSAPRADARFAVQAAAPRSEQAARELMARLKSAGLPAYVERTEAADGPRWRVRAGPFATRADADRARSRLRELGQGADLVAL